MTVLSEALRDEGRLEVGQVLVAIADDEAVFVLHRGEGDEKLRFAAGFESETPRPARVDDLLHEVALLVHLHGEDPAVGALVVVLLDGLPKALVDEADPVLEDPREANEQGQVQAARGEAGGQVVQVDAPVHVRVRSDLHVPPCR